MVRFTLRYLDFNLMEHKNYYCRTVKFPDC